MRTTVVYIGLSKPEKGLIEKRDYKAYLSEDIKDEILKELQEQVKDIEEWEVSMHVNIEIKKYKK